MQPGISAGEAVRRLKLMTDQFGVATIAERLEAEPFIVTGLVEGEFEPDAGLVAGIEGLCESLSELIDFWDDPDLIGERDVAFGSSPVDGFGSDGMGAELVAPESFGPVAGPGDSGLGRRLPAAQVLAARSMTLEEQQEQRRLSLWNTWALALTSQFRLDLDYRDHLASMELVISIEYALIGQYGASVPDATAEWDQERRLREMATRLARLRWVRAKVREEESGLKGLWNWISGRPRISGKDLYNRMVAEADAEFRGGRPRSPLLPAGMQPAAPAMPTLPRLGVGENYVE